MKHKDCRCAPNKQMRHIVKTSSASIGADESINAIALKMKQHATLRNGRNHRYRLKVLGDLRVEQGKYLWQRSWYKNPKLAEDEIGNVSYHVSLMVMSIISPTHYACTFQHQW